VGIATSFTDHAIAWGTIGLAIATVLLATATVFLVAQTRSAAAIARATFKTEIDPLLVDVPPSAEAPRDMARTRDGKLERFALKFRDGLNEGAIDPRRVHVGERSMFGAPPRVVASVPLRNVGRGLARVLEAELQGSRKCVDVSIRRDIVPPGESTRIDFVTASQVVRDAYTDGELDLRVRYADAGRADHFDVFGKLVRSTEGSGWYLTAVDHTQVLLAPSTWVLDNFAVSALGLRFSVESRRTNQDANQRLVVRIPFTRLELRRRAPSES
jgi:hypothetical protein